MQKPTPPPADEPHVLFNRKRNKAEQLKYNTIQNIDDDEKEFEALLRDFDTNPVVVMRRGLATKLREGYGIDAPAILKERAKAANRLFVELWEGFSGDYMLTVKNTGSGARLVANLLLIAKPFGTANEPLTVEIMTRKWVFRFNRLKGKELLSAWIDHCRTDIRAQFALGFGKALTDPVEFDEEGNFK